jgi:hypothetical protein
VIGIAAGGALVAPAAAWAEKPAPSPAPRADRTGVEIPAEVHSTFRLPAVDGVRYTPNARNVAMRSSADAPLLLFLPATNEVPENYQRFLGAASSVGYHVLALDYWNRGLSVARTCERNARCYSQLQANRFDGSHPSRFSAIAPSDSILARLRHALTHLRTTDHAGGWGRFLDGDRVRWNRIVLAGHSQGGGESAFIAHGHRVQGVLMFGSPVESVDGVTAAWMQHRSVTPADRYYALDSQHDMYADRIQGSWHALHLPGRPTVIGTAAPERMSHQLVTDVRLGDPHACHVMFIVDRGPMGERDTPLFRGVWLSMLQAVRGSSIAVS